MGITHGHQQVVDDLVADSGDADSLACGEREDGPGCLSGLAGPGRPLHRQHAAVQFVAQPCQARLHALADLPQFARCTWEAAWHVCAKELARRGIGACPIEALPDDVLRKLQQRSFEDLRADHRVPKDCTRKPLRLCANA